MDEYEVDYTDMSDAFPGYIMGGVAGLATGAYTGSNPVVTAAVFSAAAGTMRVTKSMYRNGEFREIKERALNEFSELFQ